MVDLWVRLRVADPAAYSALTALNRFGGLEVPLTRLSRAWLWRFTLEVPNRAAAEAAVESWACRSEALVNPNQHAFGVGDTPWPAADPGPVFWVATRDRPDHRGREVRALVRDRLGEQRLTDAQAITVWELALPPSTAGELGRRVANGAAQARGHRRGLLANPYAQDWAVLEASSASAIGAALALPAAAQEG